MNLELFIPELTVVIARDGALKEWPPHEKALKVLNQKMIWNFADTRPTAIYELQATQPHVVYFYCHGGVRENIPYLKIGGEGEMGITPDNLDIYNR